MTPGLDATPGCRRRTGGVRVRWALAGLLLAGWLLVAAQPAAAHAAAIGSSPAADAVLSSAPERVEVRFDSELLDVGAAMVVRNSAGRTVSAGPIQVQHRAIAVTLDPAAGPGRYTVAYRVVSADGHEIRSQFGFTVDGATSVPAPTVAARPSTGFQEQPKEPKPAVDPEPDAPAPPGGPPLIALVGILTGVGVVLLVVGLISGPERGHD